MHSFDIRSSRASNSWRQCRKQFRSENRFFLAGYEWAREGHLRQKRKFEKLRKFLNLWRLALLDVSMSWLCSESSQLSVESLEKSMLKETIRKFSHSSQFSLSFSPHQKNFPFPPLWGKISVFWSWKLFHTRKICV